MKTNCWNRQLLSNQLMANIVKARYTIKQQKYQYLYHLPMMALVILSFCHLQLFAQDNDSGQIQLNQLKIANKISNELISSDTQSWLFVQPFTAQYTVSSDGDQIGLSNRELSLSENIWQLSTDASVSKYIFKMTSQELSKFAFINQQLRTLEFDSRTKISYKKERHMNQVFNWQSGIEVGKKDKKHWQLEHEQLAFDRVSHLIQLRADLQNKKSKLSYNVSYKGKLQEYLYTNHGPEVIETELGKLNTIKLIREKSDGDIFILWMSPELNYFPVQIAQLEEDKPDITMTLKSLQYSPLKQANEKSSQKD